MNDSTSGKVVLDTQEIADLLAVANVYLESFGADELVSMGEAMSLTRLRDIVEKYAPESENP